MSKEKESEEKDDPLQTANCQECMEPECESCMRAFRRYEQSSLRYDTGDKGDMP